MTSYEKNQYDIEYGREEQHHSILAPDESGAVHGESFTAGTGVYYKLQRIAGRFGVEQRGIERVPDDERSDKSVVKVGTMVGSLQRPLMTRGLSRNSGLLPTWWFPHSPSEHLLFLSSISASSIPS